MPRIRGVPVANRSIHPRVHPVLRTLFDLQANQELTDFELGRRAGYSHKLFSNWRHNRGTPTLTTLSDVAEFFGYEVTLTKKEPKDAKA